MGSLRSADYIQRHRPTVHQIQSRYYVQYNSYKNNLFNQQAKGHPQGIVGYYLNKKGESFILLSQQSQEPPGLGL